MDVKKNGKTLYSLLSFGIAFALFALFISLVELPDTARTFLFVASVFWSIMGAYFLFTGALSKVVEPVVSDLEEDLEDDIEALRQGEITPTWWMVIISFTVLLVFSFLTLKYGKLSATWGDIPVWIIGFVVSGLIAFGVTRTELFQEQYERLPFWIYLIPLLGIILSTSLGIGFMESQRVERTERTSGGYYSTYYYYPHYFSSYSSDGSSSSVDFEMPKCSGKNCGSGYLVLGLIILTVILVVGSAFIEHFWLFSGILFGTLLLLITIRELRVRERRWRRSQSF
jgi:hypothetical protein